MEDKIVSTHGGLADMNAMKLESILVQVTTMKLTKDNYLPWATTIKISIVGRRHVNYIKRKKRQPSEEYGWNQWYLEDNQVKT